MREGRAEHFGPRDEVLRKIARQPQMVTATKNEEGQNGGGRAPGSEPPAEAKQESETSPDHNVSEQEV